MSVEQARFNMIEQQIRTWEVLDQDVLDLLYAVRREEFVPAAYRDLAFSDLEIPLYVGAAEGERMLQPKIEARILQELAVRKSERVLEVGAAVIPLRFAARGRTSARSRSVPD
jgi:protein-L-isoaspartate(D-aspartate) O-methyltransferase